MPSLLPPSHRLHDGRGAGLALEHLLRQFTLPNLLRCDESVSNGHAIRTRCIYGRLFGQHSSQAARDSTRVRIGLRDMLQLAILQEPALWILPVTTGQKLEPSPLLALHNLSQHS